MHLRRELQRWSRDRSAVLRQRPCTLHRRDVLAACKDDPDGAGCNNYLLRCECDCTAVDPTTEFEHGPFEDVFLTGIPNLWQFDFMCGDNNVSANAVGCGPVAAAMVMYWWAQQGYEGLVDEFLHGSGSPAEEPHDWQDLVVSCAQTTWTAASACRRADAKGEPEPGDLLGDLFGLAWKSAQYATPMWKMTTGLREYIEDAGYDVDVDHWKVCEDCNAGATDEILGGEALKLIKDELEAGRPVIMGFNAGKAFEVSIQVSVEGMSDTLYLGDLSNGAAVTGIINHYALITGYRRMGGLDVLTLNRGLAQTRSTDVDVLWNPAGKWLHLYTVDITSAPDGHRPGARSIAVSTTKAIHSHAQCRRVLASVRRASRTSSARRRPTTNELTPLAGTSCGIAREGVESRYRA